MKTTTVSTVSRTCARSTCPDGAVATLSYSYADRVVWVELLTEESHPMVHDLCEYHAGSVNVPLGWELRDQRSQGARSNGPVAAGPGGTPVRSVRFDLIGA